MTNLAKPLLEASRLLGGDAAANTELFTRVIGDWSVANEDAAGTLDQFFAASQATGIGMDTLMGKVVQFGAQIVLSSGLDSPLFVCGASPFSELLSSAVRVAAFADQIFRIK